MKYLLDTNVLSDFVRGHAEVLARLRATPNTLLGISALTELEVEYGLAKNPALRVSVADAMRALLDAITVLPFEREDARVAAQLRATLNAQGTPIGAYDLLVAATALRRGLIVITANPRELSRIGGLAVEDWRGTTASPPQA